MKTPAWILFEKEIARIHAESDPLLAKKYNPKANAWILEATALLELGVGAARARLFNTGTDGSRSPTPPEFYWDAIQWRVARLNDVIEKLNEFEIPEDFPERWAEWKAKSEG